MDVIPTTPHSVIKFYKTDFVLDDNALVDDLSDYLRTLDTFDINYFQYQKHNDNLVIKIADAVDNSYDNYQIDIDYFDYNYCSIQNVNSTTDIGPVYYYFVIDNQPVSQHTLQLTLALDTVNSLPNVNNDFLPENFLEGTQIVRQHQDRLATSVKTGLIYRKIDKESEGINISNQNKATDEVLKENEIYDWNWYVIYKSGQLESISTYLLADGQIGVAVTPSTVGDIRPTDITANLYYYATQQQNPSLEIKAKCNTHHSYDDNIENFEYRPLTFGERFTVPVIYQGNIYERHFLLKGIKIMTEMHNDKPKLYIGLYGDSPISGATHASGNFDYSSTYYITPPITGGIASPLVYDRNIDSEQDASNYDMDVIEVDNLIMTYNTTDGATAFTDIASKYTSTTDWDISSAVYRNTIPFEEFDISDPTITKIIKMPYCPVEHHTNISGYELFQGWTPVGGLLKYQGNNLPDFKNDDVVKIGTDDFLKYILPHRPTLTDSKQINAESKLYHSDFSTIKLLYDSFSKQIRPESFDITQTTSSPNISIDFKPTNTINSKMLFKVNYDDVAPYEKQEDYEEYLLVTRNNEVTCLNNEFLNYLKNGYNYDKKANALALEQQTKQSAANIISNAAQTALSTGIGLGLNAFRNKAIGLAKSFQNFADYAQNTGTDPAWQNYVLTNIKKEKEQSLEKAAQFPAYTIGNLVGQGVNGASGLISSIYSAVQNRKNTEQQQALALQTKLAQAAQQSATVSGTDDIDLMTKYCDNRLHYLVYQPNNIVKEQLYDIFDYTGYSHNRKEKPNVSSRIWRNFLQCTPKLSTETKRFTKTSWITDFIQRYEIGVTVFHHNTVEQEEIYDWENQYENWESGFFS